jgi:hypothetical protein
VTGLVCPTGSSRCGGGTVGGNGSCYTLTERGSDPLHCTAIVGTCGTACATDQVCALGTCTGFFTSAACTACPCAACGVGTTCCDYPGSSEPICVEGSSCPQ